MSIDTGPVIRHDLSFVYSTIAYTMLAILPPSCNSTAVPAHIPGLSSCLLGEVDQ